MQGLVQLRHICAEGQCCSLFTVCVQLWTPPVPPQSAVCLGWWQAPPWRVHRNPPHSSSESAPWPPEAEASTHSADVKCVLKYLNILMATYRFFKGGKELDIGLKLLCCLFKCLIIWGQKRTRWENEMRHSVELCASGFHLYSLILLDHTSVCAFFGRCIHDICTSGSGNSWTLTST